MDSFQSVPYGKDSMALVSASLVQEKMPSCIVISDHQPRMPCWRSSMRLGTLGESTCTTVDSQPRVPYRKTSMCLGSHQEVSTNIPSQEDLCKSHMVNIFYPSASFIFSFGMSIILPSIPFLIVVSGNADVP